MSEREVVFVEGMRTAFGRMGGTIRDIFASKLASIGIKGLLDKTRILEKAHVDSVFLGSAMPCSQSGNDNRGRTGIRAFSNFLCRPERMRSIIFSRFTDHNTCDQTNHDRAPKAPGIGKIKYFHNRKREGNNQYRTDIDTFTQRTQKLTLRGTFFCGTA